MAVRKPRKPRPAPQAVDVRSGALGLRTVAVFEALKGTLVLLLELGLLSLVHRNLGEVAESTVRHLHLNPERRMSHAFIEAASKFTDTRLWAVAAGGLVYAAVRFTEAYGLWNRRVWAEWFALLSGAMYLPWELYEFAARATPIRATILLVNLAIVLYMVYIRFQSARFDAAD